MKDKNKTKAQLIRELKELRKGNSKSDGMTFSPEQVSTETNLLRATVEKTTDFIGVSDQNGQILYINRAGRDMIGIEKDADLSNLRIPNCHPDWSNDILLDKALPVAESKGIWNGEVAFVHRDGREILTSMVLLSHKTPRGDVEYFSTISRDKTEEEKVYEKNRRIALAATTIEDGICITDLELGIEFVNPALERMLGYETDELLGLPASTLYKGGMNNRVLQQIIESLPAGGWSGEVELISKQGELIPTLDIAKSMRDKDEKVVGYVCVHTDIRDRMRVDEELRIRSEQLEKIIKARTGELEKELLERKSVEEALRASEEYAKNIIESSLDMIIAVDNERKVTRFNRAAEETFGYHRKNVLGKHVDFLYVNPREGLAIHNSTVAHGRFVQEVTSRRKNGEIFTSILSSSVLINSEGKRVGVMGISRDINEQRLAEGTLRESEEKYHRLFENIPVGLGVLDLEGRIIDFNEAMLTPGGYSREDITKIGNMNDLYYDPKESVKVIKLAQENGFLNRYEVRLKRKDRSPYDILLSLTPVTVKGRACWLILIEDITDRKKAELDLKKKHTELRTANDNLQEAYDHETQLRDKLINAERLASLGKISTKIAHEINNPLTVIMGYIQMELLQDHPDKLTETLKQVNEKAIQIKNLTRGYMNLGKSQKSEFEVLRLGKLIHSTIASIIPLGSLKHVEIKEEYMKAEPEILGDSGKLEQVFRNLILNAVDATSGASKKAILAGTKLSEDGESVEAYVSDTGIGIDPEDLENIFEDFYTTKDERVGTGLGLSISKEIVESVHGGKLAVDSVLGEGATFQVILPVLNITIKKKKILLVDDEPYVSQIIGKYLFNNGFNVRKAGNGKEALEEYLNFEPDLIISDIQMPLLNGIELLKEIKKINPNQPFIMTTGFSSKDYAMGKIKQFKVPILKKPIALEDELLKEVNNVLLNSK